MSNLTSIRELRNDEHRYFQKVADLELSAKDLKSITTFDSPVVGLDGSRAILVLFELVLTGATTLGTMSLEIIPISVATTIGPVIPIATGIIETTAGTHKYAILLARGMETPILVSDTGAGSASAGGITALGLFQCKFRLNITAAYDSATSAVGSLEVILKR